MAQNSPFDLPGPHKGTPDGHFNETNSGPNPYCVGVTEPQQLAVGTGLA